MAKYTPTERSLVAKLSSASKRARRLEKEIQEASQIIYKTTAERRELLRELASWHEWGLWVAQRINYLEQKSD